MASVMGRRERAEDLALRMTDELRSSERRFELAVSATEEGIWEWRSDQRSLYLSSRCDRLLGYREGTQPRSARGVLRNVTRASRRDLLLAFRRHTKAPEIPLYCVLQVRRIDCSVGWFHVAGKAEFDGAGRHLRTAGAASDVTELRRAQQAVTEFQQTPATEEALYIMSRSYDRLQLLTLRRSQMFRILQILQESRCLVSQHLMLLRLYLNRPFIL